MGVHAIRGLGDLCANPIAADNLDSAAADDDLDDEPDAAAALRRAKLISAHAIARALDSPCERCVRAEQEGTSRRDCRRLGCDRWSTRRARRWLRRAQCVHQGDSPPCPARTGGRCHCQIGLQLWPGGPWHTTLARLRDRFPDLADVLLVAQGDDD